jgi:hypothetical protein
MLLLPKLMHQQPTPPEKHAYMRLLNHLELASQLSCYPPNYLREPTPERLLETVERFEEGLNGRPASAPCGTNSGHRDRPHAQFRVLICVGEAIHIEPRRIPPGQSDPTIPHISAALQQMIHQLSSEIRNQDS